MDGNFNTGAKETIKALFEVEWDNPYQDHSAISLQRALQVNSICSKSSAYVVADTADIAESLGLDETNIVKIRDAIRDALGTSDAMFFDLPDADSETTPVMFVGLEALWDKGIKPYGMQDYLSPNYQEPQAEFTAEALVAQ